MKSFSGKYALPLFFLNFFSHLGEQSSKTVLGFQLGHPLDSASNDCFEQRFAGKLFCRLLIGSNIGGCQMFCLC
jgi:hypothetical protein